MLWHSFKNMERENLLKKAISFGRKKKHNLCIYYLAAEQKYIFEIKTPTLEIYKDKQIFNSIEEAQNAAESFIDKSTTKSKKEPKMQKEKTIKTKAMVDLSKRMKRTNNFLDIFRLAHLIPEPTYFFYIGDKVNYGDYQNVIITEIHCDNKIYGITHKNLRTNYQGMRLKYVKWLDIRQLNNHESPSLIQNPELKLNFFQSTIGLLFRMVYSSEINLNPKYQSEYVWSKQDKLYLIDTIFKNMDIDKFIFITYDNNDINREILYGKERLRAIFDFYEDRFCYKGLYFSELCKEDQHHFCNYHINIAEIKSLTEEQKISYFLRLNKINKLMPMEHLQRIENLLPEPDTN